MIEPDGGNPAAYLHGQVNSSIPTWYVPVGTTPTHFLGNYAAKGVGGISFDLDIFEGFLHVAGIEADQRVLADYRAMDGLGTNFIDGALTALLLSRRECNERENCEEDEEPMNGPFHDNVCFLLQEDYVEMAEREGGGVRLPFW